MHTQYTFETFFADEANASALAAARAAADAPGMHCSPLFLQGPISTGKTHLLQAIANRLRAEHPEMEVFCASSDYFVSLLIQAIVHRETDPLRERLLNADVLLLDDVQQLCGKQSTQKELCNAFQLFFRENRQVVLTSTLPLEELETMSHMLAAAPKLQVATLSAPDAQTRLSIVREKAEALGLNLSEAPLLYISKQAENVRQIEGALSRLLICRDFDLWDFNTENIMQMLLEDWYPSIRKTP